MPTGQAPIAALHPRGLSYRATPASPMAVSLQRLRCTSDTPEYQYGGFLATGPADVCSVTTPTQPLGARPPLLSRRYA